MANYYYNAAADTNWGTLENWWLDSTHTLSAAELPGPSDRVVVTNNVYSLGQDITINSLSAIDPVGALDFSDYSLSATETINIYGSQYTGADCVLHASAFNYYTTSGARGALSGTANFYDGSVTDTTAVVYGVANFYNTSQNLGTVVGTANFYGTSTNPGIVNGNAFVHYPSPMLTGGGTITGSLNYVGYGDKYYYNAAIDTNWGTLGNWWLDPNFTLSASELPGPTKDVIVNSSTINFFDGVNVDVNSILLDGGAYFDPMEGSGYGVKANNFIFLNGSGVNYMSLTGDCLFYQSYEDGGNNITGNVTLSGTNTTQSTTTINGNLIIYYPTIAGDLSLPTVNGTTTLVNYKFEEYPDYNFTISGLSVSSANVFYGYVGFYNGKHQWNSLDGTYSVYYNGSYDNKWWLEANNNDFGITSDQQNIDYPWNITSWTLDYGELDGTPIFNLVPFNKSNIIVSGIGDSGVEGLDLNGEYVLGYRGFGNWWGDVNEEQVGVNYGRPFYVKTNSSINYEDWSYIIAYEIGGILAWYIYNDNVSGEYLFENTDSALAYYPTDVSSWTPTALPVTGTPVLTFAADNAIAQRDAKYATATETGPKRFRRLVSLGYV